MIKKTMMMTVVCILLICTVSGAIADTIRYCPTCEGRTTFRDGCYDILKRNTAYMQHNVADVICNYYEVYFKTLQNCIGCGNLYDPNLSHKHEVIHEFCMNEYKCPF